MYYMTLEIFLFCWIVMICDIFGYFCQLSFIFWIPNKNFIKHGYLNIFCKFIGDIYIYKLFCILIPFGFRMIFYNIIFNKYINIYNLNSSINVNSFFCKTKL